jgi:hypothetical protein
MFCPCLGAHTPDTFASGWMHGWDKEKGRGVGEPGTLSSTNAYTRARSMHCTQTTGQVGINLPRNRLLGAGWRQAGNKKRGNK